MNQYRKKLYTRIIILIALFAITFFIITKNEKTEALLPSDGSKASVFDEETTITTPSTRLDQVKAGVGTTTPKPEAENLPPLLDQGGESLPVQARGGNPENPQTQDNTESVTILAGNVTANLQVAPNTIFYNALLQAKNHGQIEFYGKNYPGLGFFIKEIGTLRAGDGKYLLYYINGKEAQVGVSSYTLQDGDIIEWKLE